MPLARAGKAVGCCDPRARRPAAEVRPPGRATSVQSWASWLPPFAEGLALRLTMTGSSPAFLAPFWAIRRPAHGASGATSPCSPDRLGPTLSRRFPRGIERESGERPCGRETGAVPATVSGERRSIEPLGKPGKAERRPDPRARRPAGIVFTNHRAGCPGGGLDAARVPRAFLAHAVVVAPPSPIRGAQPACRHKQSRPPSNKLALSRTRPSPASRFACVAGLRVGRATMP